MSEYTGSGHDTQVLVFGPDDPANPDDPRDVGTYALAIGFPGVDGALAVQGDLVQLRGFAARCTMALDQADPALAEVTWKRDVLVDQMSEDQFYGLAATLGLPHNHFGKFRGRPGERRNISLDASPYSCITPAGLDTVLAYLRSQGLSYSESVRIERRYRPTPRS
jgi:hypothetical protein